MEHESFDEKDFFLKVLRSGLKNDSISDVKIVKKSNNDKKGHNFLSNLLAVTLEYTQLLSKNGSSKKIKDSANLYIKKPLADKTHALLFEMDVFDIESKILSDVLPEIEQIVGVKIGPKFIYQSKETSAIIMEDLRQFQFKNKDQKSGLSKGHLGMVIEALAKYHAGSIALEEKQPGFLQQFRQSLFSSQTHPNFLGMLETCLEVLGKNMLSWPDAKFVEAGYKLQNISKSIVESSKKNNDYDEDEFCVLNHGDCWANNVMFRENDANEPLEVRLVDFQLPIWSSPAIDLLYLLGFGPASDIMYILDDFFLEKYLTTLKNTMEKLDCKRKPLTLDELKLSMWKRRSLGLISGLIFYPKFVIQADVVVPLKEVLDHQIKEVNMYSTPEVVEKLSKVIPLIEEKGYLD
ncbi:uncharacterized protein LOC123274535 [Cotesia glomerata]|uniref:CHK kinase-like domain-containing protein n=1 Tax=Cotesia glomerata TaxID=32391 RepID=A0AAV7J823_COTGL|nr:uncharacterized protein LOC123274535 [Cotesia glomerata]KAH0567432.1 hypothetical protein KQX54_009928 [Cotesia glomerata]